MKQNNGKFCAITICASIERDFPLSHSPIPYPILTPYPIFTHIPYLPLSHVSFSYRFIVVLYNGLHEASAKPKKTPNRASDS